MNTLRATLVNAQQANVTLNQAYQTLKPYLLSEHSFDLTIKPATRTTAENSLLHSMLSHIAKTQLWAGKKHDTDTWKRLLVAAWCRARGEPVEILPALDGCGVDIVFRKTSRLTVKECADLIEYVYAWGAQNDVMFPADPRQVECEAA